MARAVWWIQAAISSAFSVPQCSNFVASAPSTATTNCTPLWRAKPASRLVSAATAGASASALVDSLRRLHEQVFVRAENGARTRHVGRQDFKAASLPAEHFQERLPAESLACRRVDDLAFLNPDAAFSGRAGDFQDGRTLREAFELDDIDERLALHTAEASGIVLLQHGLDAIDKVDDLLAGLWLFANRGRCPCA